MRLSEEKILDVVRALDPQEIDNTRCIPYNEIVNALHVDSRAALTVRGILESLESAGTVTLYRMEPGLIYGVTLNEEK